MIQTLRQPLNLSNKGSCVYSPISCCSSSKQWLQITLPSVEEFHFTTQHRYNDCTQNYQRRRNKRKAECMSEAVQSQKGNRGWSIGRERSWRIAAGSCDSKIIREFQTHRFTLLIMLGMKAYSQLSDTSSAHSDMPSTADAVILL